jgi:hypothetical protein
MSGVGAIGLRKQIEIDRQVETDELNRKFDRLLEMVESVYGVGNLAPKAAAPRKARTTKAVTATVATPTNSDTIPAPAPADAPAPAATPAEEDASYENSVLFHDNCTNIREHLLEHNDGLGKAAILEATGLVESVAMASLKKMIADGTVRPVGEKRGRKYLAVVSFLDQPAAATDTDTDGT